MTIQQTRQMEIEFERRIQTMIPDTEFADKLDTETIESFLNQYQDKYVHEIYRSLDQVPSGSRLSAHIESVLKSLMKEAQLDESENNTVNLTTDSETIVGTGRSVTYNLPEDYYMYVRSVSKVSSTYSFKGGSADTAAKIRVIPNQLVSQNDVWRLIETPHDGLRILRYPAAVLNTDSTLTVIYDRYTTSEGVKLVYYIQPPRFSLFTSTPCEMPMDAFDDIITGAVDLYVQYVAGAEARKKQLEQARQEAAKEQERNNARRGRSEE